MDTDRNLLFAVLCLQADLIDVAQLAEICTAWTARRETALADLLVERGWITRADEADVNRLLERKIKKHGGAQASLAACADASVRSLLGAIPDEQVQQSLATLSRTGDPVLAPTTNYRPETRGRYTLTRLHAHGGIGQVWLAHDHELGRAVALKELRPEQVGDTAAQSRFFEEAKVTGQLQHPGIVPVYELAWHPETKQPFYTMRFIQGRTLRTAVQDYHARHARSAAGLLDLNSLLNAFVAVCNAVAYAHSRGVLHRDLKPHNVVLGDFGEVIVLDWGLAKVLDRPEPGSEAPPVVVQPGDRHEATLQGQVLGTPSYMAPEQAAGRLDLIDARTDVYGLGAILYEILTGRPPFSDASTLDVLLKVLEQDPAPPRQVARQVHRALEAVCLKALAKQPQDRYASATELAAEVRRWLADEPVRAWRESRISRLARWGRRHKLAATGAAVLLLTAVVALAISTALLGREQRRTEEQRELAVARSQEANERAEALDRQAYVYRVNLAYRECLANNVAQAERHLDGCPEGRRGWEWAYCRRLCHMESLRIGGAASPVCLQSDVVFGPDGTTIVTAGLDGMVHFWDVNTGQERRGFRAHSKPILGLSVSQEGMLATGSDGEVKLWEAKTGRELHCLRGPAGWARPVRFSPDSRRLAAGFGTGIREVRRPQVHVWDTQTGRELASFAGRQWGQLSLAFRPDSRQITGMNEWDTILYVWDVAAAREVRADDVGVGGVFEVAYRPDGQEAALACRDGNVLLWDPAAHVVRRTLRGHTGVVLAVVFSPDGRLLASGSLDGAIKLWEPATGREVANLRGHTEAVRRVQFSPDGSRLASQGDDGAVRLWEVTSEPDVLTLQGNLGWAFRTAFSPDGQQLVTAGFNVVRVRDARTGEILVTVPSVHGGVQGLALSPDGRQVVCSSEFAKDFNLHDTATGRHLVAFRGHTGFVRAVAFSPDGRQVASAGEDQTVRLWDAASGREVLTVRGHTGGVYGVTFSPDGRRLASMSWDDSLRLWDVATGQEVGSFAGAGRAPTVLFGNVLAFSPDGRRLAAVGRAHTVVIRDTESGPDLLTLVGHTGDVNGIAFSPDGRRLISAAQDNTVKVWDAATAEEMFTLRGHSDGVLGVAMSPDGNRIASASQDLTVRVWQATDLEPAVARRRWLLAQAEPLVESLLEQPLLKEEMIERLRGDAALLEPVRGVALELATRAVEVPVLLNNASWEVVRNPNRPVADYERALRLAERACRLQPDVRSFQNTLGVAQYRLGRYPDARQTLLRSDRLNLASGGTSDPVDLAFLAMVHHRQGQHAEARACLGRLHEAIKAVGGPGNPDVKAILREAETLIQPPALPKGERSGGTGAMTFRRMSSFRSVEELRRYAADLGFDEPIDERVEAGPGAPLGQPYTWRGGTVGNRFAILPMEGWDGTEDGRPSELTRRRWQRFGRSGAKLIWGGEAVAVRPDGRANPNQLLLSEDSVADLADLRRLLVEAHREALGSDRDLLVGLQLTHSGRFSHTQPRVLYRHPCLDGRTGVTEEALLTDNDVSQLVDDFVRAARLAQQAGFAFVDIKHCHGYLGHEFLSAVERPGRYGGNLENRTRFLREVIAGVRAAAPGLEVGVRVSVFDFRPFRAGPEGQGEPVPRAGAYPYAFGGEPATGLGYDLREPAALLAMLEGLGVHWVCTTAGSPYYNPHVQRPAAFPPSDGYLPPEDPLAGVARQITATAILKGQFPNMAVVGSAYSYLQEWLPHVAQAVVRTGAADFVGLGRMALAYPELPADVLAGRPPDRRRLCRTFSDCTTGPRNGMVSGCYPLDPFYHRRPERQRIAMLRRRGR